MKRVTSKDGTAIAFDRSGQGPAVILISGASTSRIANAALAELLSSHYGLVDEYQLWLHPVVLGSGKRLFRDGGSTLTMRLVDS